MRYLRFRWIAFSLLVMCGHSTAAQAAAVLRLSDVSSNQTPPRFLNATLVFSVLEDELTLSVTNDTFPPHGFHIDAVHFNAAPHVEGLLMSTPVPGWSLEEDVAANGFGRFRFALLTDPGTGPEQIAPGATQDFTFDIVGSGPFAPEDFTTFFSTIPPGNTPALAAVKFVRGPKDASAFGAVIPEPATLLLAAFGAGWLVWPRRRPVPLFRI